MIFVAKKEELPFIIKKALEVPEELGIESLPEVSADIVAENIYEAWKKSPVFVSKDSEGKIQGFVVTTLTKSWWSNDTLISDLVWFIEKEHKNGKVFDELVTALKDFAKLNKLQVVLQFVSQKRTALKEKLFERKGFEKVGFLVSFKG